MRNENVQLAQGKERLGSFALQIANHAICHVLNIQRTLSQDTRTNELDLHPRLHRLFADGTFFTDADAMVDWIYEHLFLMPPDDPFMGLDAPDAFSALPS